MSFPEGHTSEEENAIEELRSRTENFLTPKLAEDPTLFYRFLKARDFDVDKAQNMLMKHIKWRKVNQVDTILEDLKLKEYNYKYALPSHIGFDKDGDVIEYSPIGKIESSDILKCDKFNNYKKSLIWYAETTAALVKQRIQTGKVCNQVTMIFDLEKLTFSNATHKISSEIFLTVMKMFQDNYPERMKAAYVINAPGYYVIIYSVLKAIISNAMLQKIHVFRQNGWKEKFLSKIGANVLPAFLGGNRTDPDGNPLCLTFVRHGGKFPPKYYLSAEDRFFKAAPNRKGITIPHRERKEFYLEITAKGSTIRWEYFVKSKDVGFGLFFQESQQSTREEIIPIERYSTVDGTEMGFYKSQSIGTYIIVFDNSHSWISSKEIEYCFLVIKPE